MKRAQGRGQQSALGQEGGLRSQGRRTEREEVGKKTETHTPDGERWGGAVDNDPSSEQGPLGEQNSTKIQAGTTEGYIDGMRGTDKALGRTWCSPVPQLIYLRTGRLTEQKTVAKTVP